MRISNALYSQLDSINTHTNRENNQFAIFQVRPRRFSSLIQAYPLHIAVGVDYLLCVCQYFGLKLHDHERMKKTAENHCVLLH